MITLYHGSSAKVEAPLVHLGRTDLDFGQGFYLTQLKEQAEAWAVIICSRKKLVYHKPNHQICLLNQAMVDKYLHYISSEIISLKED